MENIKENQQDIRGETDKVSKDIEKLTQDISDLFDQKSQKREDYWKARYDFEIQKEEIQYIEWMIRQKERVIQRAQEDKVAAEERDNIIKNLPHPYEKELDTCSHIINYLNELKRKAGLVQDDDLMARQTQSNFLAEAAKKNLDKKIEEGKLQTALSKQQREEQNMVRVGGGEGKKKGKKPKAPEQHVFEFNIDIMVIKKFGLIQVSPPVNLDDLDGKIAEIQKKQAWYTENGEVKLKEQIEELRKFNEQQAKEESKQKDEVDDGVVFEQRGRGRGGRGGRGRGNRGGYGEEGRSRGGRGGRGRQDFRIKNEFEGDSEDDFSGNQPKPQQPKRKQKAEDLLVDDENYPTL